MPNPWPLVPLEEVLQPILRRESLDPMREYACLGVRLDGGGPFLRETKPGSQIASRTLFQVKAGDFIYSRLFAWRGAFGVIRDEFDGSYVSSEFPTFQPVHGCVDVEFLRLWFRLPATLTRVEADCTGSTPLTRNRFKEEFFLAMKIPLPPLDEQRRIVARIEQLAAKIQEARGLRLQACEEADSILAGEELKIWPDAELGQARTLGEVTTFLARGRQSQQGPSDHFLIKTQHVQLGGYIPTQFTLVSHVTNRVKPDAMARPHDVLIACSAAGCLGRVAVYTDAARKASTDTHVAIARARSDLVLPEYLYAYLRGAQGQRQLRSREKGDWQREKVGFRLTELNVADMRRVPVPVPPLAEQRRIVAYMDALQAKVDALKKLQADTAAELDALLPSIVDKAFKGGL